MNKISKEGREGREGRKNKVKERKIEDQNENEAKQRIGEESKYDMR